MSEEPQYPNRLRETREQERLLTRAALIARTEELATENPAIYTRVSLSALRALESGLSRPQLKTLATLSKALDTEPKKLFPLGADDHIRK